MWQEMGLLTFLLLLVQGERTHAGNEETGINGAEKRGLRTVVAIISKIVKFLLLLVHRERTHVGYDEIRNTRNGEIVKDISTATRSWRRENTLEMYSCGKIYDS